MTDKENLSYDNIRILMETYQNVVELNTILLEQHKQILNLQSKLVEKQDELAKNQKITCNQVNSINSKLDTNYSEIKNETKDLESALHLRFNTAETKLEKIKDDIDSVKLDMIHQHAGISHKLYIALIGSVLIILTLIGMLMSGHIDPSKTRTIDHFTNIGSMALSYIKNIF